MSWLVQGNGVMVIYSVTGGAILVRIFDMA